MKLKEAITLVLGKQISKIYNIQEIVEELNNLYIIEVISESNYKVDMIENISTPKDYCIKLYQHKA